MASREREPKNEGKKPYHTPHLETYGDVSELTKTAAGSGRPDGTGQYGITRYSN